MYSELTDNRSKSADTLAGSDYYVTEKGDVNRPKSAGIKIRKQPDEKSNEEKSKVELLEAPSPFRIISERTPLMDLNGLLHITPEPLPTLKNMKTCKSRHSYIICILYCVPQPKVKCQSSPIK